MDYLDKNMVPFGQAGKRVENNATDDSGDETIESQSDELMSGSKDLQPQKTPTPEYVEKPKKKKTPKPQPESAKKNLKNEVTEKEPTGPGKEITSFSKVLQEGHWALAMRGSKEDRALEQKEFVEIWGKAVIKEGESHPNMTSLLKWGKDVALQFATEKDLQAAEKLKFKREDGKRTVRVVRYKSPFNHVYHIKDTSATNPTSIKNALVSAFPEDNFCLYQEINKGYALDQFFVVFYRPPSRTVKQLEYANAKGLDGTPWKSSVIAEKGCSACGMEEGHRVENPCPHWRLVLKSDHANKGEGTEEPKTKGKGKGKKNAGTKDKGAEKVTAKGTNQTKKAQSKKSDKGKAVEAGNGGGDAMDTSGD